MSAPSPPAALYRHRHAFTPRQEREHRTLTAAARRSQWQLGPHDRRFVEAIGRLHGNLSVAQGDHLAGLAERLFWAARDGVVA